MKSRPAMLLALVAAMTVAIVVAYRCVWIANSATGDGKFRESPDKQFTASAFSMTEPYFFGGQRRYHEFLVQGCASRQVRRVVIEEPPEGMVDWRHDGSITWSNDSSSVTYSFKGTQLKLETKDQKR